MVSETQHKEHEKSTAHIKSLENTDMDSVVPQQLIFFESELRKHQ